MNTVIIFLYLVSLLMFTHVGVWGLTSSYVYIDISSLHVLVDYGGFILQLREHLDCAEDR